MNGYCDINDANREHIKNLIRWIFNEVSSAGGDGDALWYSEYFNVEDILPLVEEVKEELGYKWNIKMGDMRLSCSFYQEGFCITNNKKDWDEAPSWQQVKINY